MTGPADRQERINPGRFPIDDQRVYDAYIAGRKSAAIAAATCDGLPSSVREGFRLRRRHSRASSSRLSTDMSRQRPRRAVPGLGLHRNARVEPRRSNGDGGAAGAAEPLLPGAGGGAAPSPSQPAWRPLFVVRAAPPLALTLSDDVEEAVADEHVDELDALVPRRGGDSSSQASERVVNQMLTEIMYRQLLEHLGYARDLDLAELEITLEGEGRLDEFKATYKRLFPKKDWDKSKNLVAFAHNIGSPVDGWGYPP